MRRMLFKLYDKLKSKHCVTIRWQRGRCFWLSTNVTTGRRASQTCPRLQVEIRSSIAVQVEVFSQHILASTVVGYCLARQQENKRLNRSKQDFRARLKLYTWLDAHPLGEIIMERDKTARSIDRSLFFECLYTLRARCSGKNIYCGDLSSAVASPRNW